MIPTPAGNISLSTIEKQMNKMENGTLGQKMIYSWNKSSDKAMREFMRMGERGGIDYNWGKPEDFIKSIKSNKHFGNITFWQGIGEETDKWHEAVIKYINEKRRIIRSSFISRMYIAAFQCKI